MRERLRAILTIVTICVRADRWRNAFILASAIVQQVMPIVSVVFLASFAQAVASHDIHTATQAGATMGLIWVGTELLYVFKFRIDMRVRETGGHALDVHLLDLMSAIPGIDHLERPEHADKVLLLQRARWQLASIVPALVSNVALAVQLIFTAFSTACVRRARRVWIRS